MSSSTVSVRLIYVSNLQPTIDVVVDRIAKELALRDILEVIRLGRNVNELHRSIIALDRLPWSTGSHTSGSVSVAADGEVGRLWVWL